MSIIKMVVAHIVLLPIININKYSYENDEKNIAAYRL